jgi:hypothetical protein
MDVQACLTAQDEAIGPSDGFLSTALMRNAPTFALFVILALCSVSFHRHCCWILPSFHHGAGQARPQYDYAC